MTSPVKFRPEDDPHPDSPVEWADNWLSNLFAWASKRFTPAWCQTPEHWTSRITQYLFTDCPCCLLFRGLLIGMSLVLIPLWIVALLAWITW